MERFKKAIEGIKPLDKETMAAALKRMDSLAKPIGSLGRLEEIAVRIAGMTGKTASQVEKKCVIVMSSDNGVCEEGVSSCPQVITAIQTVNFIKGITGIGVLARHGGSDLKVIDLGIAVDIEHSGLINKKIRKGTWNIARGPAMTREEALSAIEIGIETVMELAASGYSLLGTGEMGIGNTSTSSAVLMALTGCSEEKAVGMGAGLTEEGYANKKRIIKQAIEINKPDKSDPIDVLAKVGGFDIAGLAGCFIGAAYRRIPIVIDGFISAAAALAAVRLNPLVKEYIITSHFSEEPGYKIIMEELGLEPILNLKMRLGEGTGCPLAFNIIEAALVVMRDMATFEEASIVNDFMIDIR